LMEMNFLHFAVFLFAFSMVSLRGISVVMAWYEKRKLSNNEELILDTEMGTYAGRKPKEEIQSIDNN